MLFNNTKVYNFEQSLYGMRNPKNSWAKSDSQFGLISKEDLQDKIFEVAHLWVSKAENEELLNFYKNRLRENGILREENGVVDFALIGPNDMKLAQNLIKAGSEHRKFLRQIFVSVDITAPLYWWSEMDTYKVATTANSTSKMHTLASSPITLKNFETNDFSPDLVYYEIKRPNSDEIIASNDVSMLADFMIEQLEFLRQKYLETKDKRYWKELVRWLPSGWLQTRTWTANYETLRAICSPGQRRFHKLNEWGGVDNPKEPNFIAWARQLPFAQWFIFDDENIPF